MELSKRVAAKRTEYNDQRNHTYHKNRAIEKQRGDVRDLPRSHKVLPVRMCCELYALGHGALRLQCCRQHADEGKHTENNGQGKHHITNDAHRFRLLHRNHLSFPFTKRCTGPTTSSTSTIKVTAKADARPTLC